MESIRWEMFVNETVDTIETIHSELDPSYQGLIVWFHADWCGPCRRIEADVEQLVSSDSGNRWKWLDIQVPQDDFDKQELKDLWGFKTIPIFCVREKGSQTEFRMLSWESLKEFVIEQK